MNDIYERLDHKQEMEAEQEENCMKTIKLKKIELTNFKGIAHRIEEFKDGENFIFGANGTGKTTVFDGFTWCLFAKDSHGQAEEKAKIKMLDSDGKPIMHTDNSVEITLDVDGEELVLKRTYKEKWRKPSGQSEQVYDGQKTEFSWNGNEKISATEYKKRVSELIDEGLFKLITDPLYFPSLDVKERRNIVLAMAGEISDEVIRASNAELKDFDAKGNVDEKRNVALSTKNRLVKDRDNYPARIDEQMQTITRKEQELSELGKPDLASITSEKQLANDKIAEIEELQSNVAKQVSDITQKNAERISAINKVDEYKQRKQKEVNDEVAKKNVENHANISKVYELKTEISAINHRIEKGKVEINATKNELNELQAKIAEKRAVDVPDFDVVEECPTCHRPFEQDTLEVEKEKMREDWIVAHKEEIARLQDKGNQLFESGKKYKDAIEELEKQKEELTLRLSEIEPLIVEDLPFVTVDFSVDEEYQQLLKDIPDELSVADEINKQTLELAEQKKHYQEIIQGLDEKLGQFTKIDMLKKDIEVANNRIQKLKVEQLQVNQGIADQEKIIYLCDLWTKTKVDILNDRVSSKFDLVKFKMFNFTQEGNAKPTCEITVNGVDYTALNTASKINAGLDIINALINYYNVKAPIFIDNRESVTNIVAPDTQIINLAVTGGEN